MNEKSVLYPQFGNTVGMKEGPAGQMIQRAVAQVSVETADTVFILIDIDEILREEFKKQAKEFPDNHVKVKQLFHKMPLAVKNDIIKRNGRHCFTGEYVEKWLGPIIGKL